MIAYVVELWCDKCPVPKKVFGGTVHSDLNALPQLGRNLTQMAVEKGWKQDGVAIICPNCQKREVSR